MAGPPAKTGSVRLFTCGEINEILHLEYTFI